MGILGQKATLLVPVLVQAGDTIRLTGKRVHITSFLYYIHFRLPFVCDKTPAGRI